MLEKHQRDLLSFEKYNACRNRLGLYNNYHLTAKYNKKITPELLSTALHLLLKKYSVFTLTHIPENDGERPVANDLRLTPADSLLFEDLVEIVDFPFDESQLFQINERSCRSYYPEVSWKLILFSNNYLTFYCNHISLDGQSAVEFHRELATIFNELEGSELTHQLIVYTYDAKQFEMSPKNTDVFDLYDCSKLELAKFVIQEMVPKSIKNLYNYYFTSGFPDYSKNPLYSATIQLTPRSLFKLVHVDSATMRAFLKVLKQNNLTVTPFLDVLLNYCFNQTILQHENQDIQYSTKSTAVISGRRFYPELKEKLKFHITVTACSFLLPPVDSFDMEKMVELLKGCDKTIKDVLNNRAEFRRVSLLDVIDPYDIVKPDQKDVVQETLFEISNLGYNQIESGTWKVEDVVFSQTVGTSCLFGFSCISTPGGMNISLGYLEKYKDYPIDEMVNLFKSCITKIAATA